MSLMRLITADELEQMSEDDSAIQELEDGILISRPLACEDEAHVCSNICFSIATFVKTHGLGRAYPPSTGFRLDPGTVYGPRAAFVRKGRLNSLHGHGFAQGAPDLAVEILSPFHNRQQLERKAGRYFAAGCHTVWIVNRELHQVELLDASGARHTLHAGDLLEAPELLPGFSVRVAEIFEP